MFANMLMYSSVTPNFVEALLREANFQQRMSVYYLICPGTTSVNLVRAHTWSAPRTYFCNSNDWVQSPQGRAHPSVSSIALSIFLAWTRFKRNVKCPTIPPPTYVTFFSYTSWERLSLVPRPNFSRAPCGLVEKQGLDTFTAKTGASLYMAGSKLGNCRC